jgi:serine O-acetyltransferase
LGDARAIADRDPAAKSLIEVILLYPGFHALFFHRIAHWLYNKKLFFIARLVSQLSRFITGIEIHPGAKIGKGLFIDHGMGIVIGETAYIGDNCTIYHGVTLGGTGKHKGKRHPSIGNNVLIGAGAKLLGPITVGDNTMVGAGSVLLDDVEPFTTVTGPKARAVKKYGKKVMPSIELDHIHVPDPVSQEVCRLDLRLAKLEEILKAAEATEPGADETSCGEQSEDK